MPRHRLGTRHKYVRTLTIVTQVRRASDEAWRRWQLIRDAKNTADLSADGLMKLSELFRTAVKPEHVGPRTFRLVLQRHGIRDAVLQTRLFGELGLQDDTGRIDSRDFVCLLALFSSEPVDSKLRLIFDSYRYEGRESLAMTELAHIAQLDLPKEYWQDVQHPIQTRAVQQLVSPHTARHVHQSYSARGEPDDCGLAQTGRCRLAPIPGLYAKADCDLGADGAGRGRCGVRVERSPHAAGARRHPPESPRSLRA